MSVSTAHPSEKESSIFVVWVLMLVALIWFLQLALPTGLYCAIYGVPSFEEWLTSEVPDLSHAALWKGRVCYPVMKVGPGQTSGQGVLRQFDPVTGDASESKFQIPVPTSGLLTQGDLLWTISPSSVVRIEDDRAIEIKPFRRLIQPTSPFLYEGQIAVVDNTANGMATLLVLQNNEWADLGRVLIPYDFDSRTVGGKEVLVPVEVKSSAPGPMLDLKVIEHQGKLHLFYCDGAIIVYRAGLELAPCSALAPANVSEVIDLSSLDGWEVVSSPSSRLYMSGADFFTVGFVDGEPVLIRIEPSQNNQIQFLGLGFAAYRRINGTWTQSARIATPGTNEFLCVTDGTKTYIASQSLMETMNPWEVTGSEFRSTGAVIKGPTVPMEAPVERWNQLSLWVFWPTLLLLAIGVSRLTAHYRGAQYQFGVTTVELASMTRRGIARAIDYYVYVIPIYLMWVGLRIPSEDQITLEVSKLLEEGIGENLVRSVWLAFGTLLLSLAILIVNSVSQGLWGITLGKWVSGIRTVRTTLRPSGVSRALVRELLLVADTCFMMTWLPVTLLIALTNCRQRIGDVVADTIVIRKPMKS